MIFLKILPQDYLPARSFILFVLLLYIPVNSYGHGGTVSSPNHTFSWASLNKWLTIKFVHIILLVTDNTLLKWEENDHSNYFMINLHKSMRTGRDPTQDPWFFSQMCISSQTSYRLRYPPWSVVYLACWISSSHPLLDALYVYKPPKSKLCRVSHLYPDCQALHDVSQRKLCFSC